MTPTAETIADSIAEDGSRVTTFLLTTHRFILAEFNTHRTLSRSSASSRAIPLRKQLEKVRTDPAIPLVFPAEQKGMQGGAEIEQPGHAAAIWRLAAQGPTHYAETLASMGVHKSVANRLLEPFLPHTIVATGTAWQNFFDQRCSSLAQPEIKALADLMRAAYMASTPRPLAEGQWHLPFIDDEDVSSLELMGGYDSDLACKVSAARCARTSYETQDGKRDIAEDLSLYERLVTARPAHWSPLEHVATPWSWNRQEGCIHFGQTKADEDDFTCIPLDHLPRVGNLVGWRSLRTTVEAQMGETTFR